MQFSAVGFFGVWDTYISKLTHSHLKEGKWAFYQQNLATFMQINMENFGKCAYVPATLWRPFVLYAVLSINPYAGHYMNQ